MANSDNSFDDLLAWLDPDREIAGQKYEVVRAGLTRMFTSRGFSDAEDLTDETVDVVKKRLPDIRETYEGDKARYFHGVARNIEREARRRKEIATNEFPERLTQIVPTSDEYDCLIKCLKFLPREKRELILDYYLYEGRDKIKLHQLMADELGITVGALRTRAHHIRHSLEKCIQSCVKELGEKQKVARSALLKRQHTMSGIDEEHLP